MLQYPDLRDGAVAVDTETKDPFLKEKGPGAFRKDGYVVGFSLSNGEFSEYYGLRHPDTTPEERNKNLNYLREQMKASNNKIFANCHYDLEWLTIGEGITINGPIDDIQIAEPLIDENRSSYSLDTLSTFYINEHKAKTRMEEWCKQNGVKGKPVENLWRMPYEVVREYGAYDTYLTYKVFEKQKPILEEQGLMGVYDLETSIVPLLLLMRKSGVRLDTNKLTKTGLELADVSYDLQEEINRIAGREINVNSNKDLQWLFDSLKVQYYYNPPTENMLLNGQTQGNPCFNKDALAKMSNPTADKILRLRHAQTLLSLFIVPYPTLLVGDRLHCRFNQLKGDEYGTVSGRFSSSQPNLQQVSAKDEDYDAASEFLSGKVIRKLFIPEEDHYWAKLDWSQIEYRLIAHYATGEGSQQIKDRYNADPKTDYHAELMNMTDINDRKTIKTLNFGSAYGMGPATMSNKYNWDMETAMDVYDMYHRKVPFVKTTSNAVGRVAKSRGYIKTIYGRRARLREKRLAYTMFNRLIQGSAADIMKLAMRQSYDRGIFNTLIPHLTVHDELDVSVPRSKEGSEALRELQYVMEHTTELRVPLYAELEVGENWGDLGPWEDKWGRVA